MSAQDKTERVLRELHVTLSKGETIPKQPDKVIVDRQKMLELLQELNACMYEIMDEHEMTLRSRDKAEREFNKKKEEIIEDAKDNAEDIYAAAFMYTDEALMHVQEIMRANTEKLESMFQEMKENLQKETKRVKTNQLELKSQLQDLKDTDKYLHLIQDRNRELEKMKTEGMMEAREEGAFYAGRKTDIKINSDYFEKLGITPEQEIPEEAEAPKKADVVIKVADNLKDVERATAADKASRESGEANGADDAVTESLPDKKDEEKVIEDLQLMDNLDAEYFQWKEEQGDKKESREKLSSTRDLTESLQKVWKTINKISNHS